MVGEVIRHDGWEERDSNHAHHHHSCTASPPVVSKRLISCNFIVSQSSQPSSIHSSETVSQSPNCDFLLEILRSCSSISLQPILFFPGVTWESEQLWLPLTLRSHHMISPVLWKYRKFYSYCNMKDPRTATTHSEWNSHIQILISWTNTNHLIYWYCQVWMIYARGSCAQGLTRTSSFWALTMITKEDASPHPSRSQTFGLVTFNLVLSHLTKLSDVYWDNKESIRIVSNSRVRKISNSTCKL